MCAYRRELLGQRQYEKNIILLGFCFKVLVLLHVHTTKKRVKNQEGVGQAAVSRTLSH